MKSSGTSRMCASPAGSRGSALRRYANASLSRRPALASSTATRSSKRLRSWPSMTIWPHAWHFSAGSCAVKVWPQASIWSSRVMATIFCRWQRPHLFTTRLPRSPGCLGRGCERRRKGARATGTAACNQVVEKSASQRHGRSAVLPVDPRVRAGLLPHRAAVEEVLRHHVAHRSEDRGADPGMLAFQLRKQSLHPLALEVLLRAAEVAGDERKLHLRGKGGDLALRRVAKWPDDHVAAVVAAQARRHRAHLSREQHGHQQRLDQVVAVVAQGDLGAAELPGRTVEDAAAQPRADGARSLSFGDEPLHHRIGVL